MLRMYEQHKNNGSEVKKKPKKHFSKSIILERLSQFLSHLQGIIKLSLFNIAKII